MASRRPIIILNQEEDDGVSDIANNWPSPHASSSDVPSIATMRGSTSAGPNGHEDVLEMHQIKGSKYGVDRLKPAVAPQEDSEDSRLKPKGASSLDQSDEGTERGRGDVTADPTKRSRSRVRILSTADIVRPQIIPDANLIVDENQDQSAGARESAQERRPEIPESGLNEANAGAQPPKSAAAPTNKAPPNILRFTQWIVNLQMLAWIWPKMKDFESMKPVIRCAVAAWIAMLFLLIHPVEKVLGQAAFFVIVVAFICPPHLPLIQTVEQIFFLFFFVGLSWAWVCLAAWFVSLARTGNINEQTLQQLQSEYSGLAATNPQSYARRLIFEGAYIEAGTAVVAAVMLGLGTAFFTWYKIHTGPTPFVFALVLACVLMDVSLTIIPLFPYDYYTSGLLFMLPMAMQLGVSLLCSLLIFPTSAASSFVLKVQAILKPLETACGQLEDFLEDVARVREHLHPSNGADSSEPALLRISTMTDDQKLETLEKWASNGVAVRDSLVSSAAGLGPCKAQEKYLDREIRYSRYGGGDFQAIFAAVETLQLRSGGVAFFFDVVKNAISHSHLDSAAFSTKDIESHLSSPAPSRPASVYREDRDEHHSTPPSITPSPLGERNDPLGAQESEANGPRDANHPRNYLTKRLAAHSIRHHHSHQRQHHHNSHSGLGLHLSGAFDRISSHQSLIEHLRKLQTPVGLYESAKWMNVEREQDGDIDHIIQQLDLLAASASPLVHHTRSALTGATLWLRQTRVSFLRLPFAGGNTNPGAGQGSAVDLSQLIVDLSDVLETFRLSDRLRVLEPYRHLLDPSHPPNEAVNYKTLKHRALFWDFVFSYHMMEFAGALLKLLELMRSIENKRSAKRMWWPSISFRFAYFQRSDDHHDGEAMAEDGNLDNDIAEPEHALHLGRAKRRDPDNQPFDRWWLNALSSVDRVFNIFSNIEFLFAIKSGLLTVLVAMPALFPSTSGFFYYNRGLWVIIMAQLTLSLYSGETAVAWWMRLRATFWGCLVGMVMWYIASGGGRGNPYGLAAVCAVVFPVLMVIRVHYPGPPLASILFTVSAAIVVGYSWVNSSLIQATNATWGWDVAWRRFVTAAWIFALLPPATSGKVRIRQSYARVVKNIGSLFCAVLDEAFDTNPERLEMHSSTKQAILAQKRKLAKLGMRHAANEFEFSLRGVWPAARYKALQDVCVDLVSLVSQLHHIVDTTPYKWRRAILIRTRLNDPQFVGDVLSLICPLIERLYQRKFGLEIAHLENDNEDEDFPTHVTAKVLESEEYLKYALGASTTYSLVRRFDKLMLICKSIVGEIYHLDNIDLGEKYTMS